MGELLNYFKRTARTIQDYDAKTARKWIIDEAQQLDKNPRGGLNEERAGRRNYTFRKDIQIGEMYLFVYDPKWKARLSWWDTHPLIFPLDVYDSGFLGINLHYLPIGYRAVLMDALYDLADKELPERGPIPDGVTLATQYGILKSFAKYRYFKPCIHRYRFDHVRSRFRLIPSSLWNKAVLIPTQRFVGAKVGEVYNDSMSKIEGVQHPNVIKPVVTKPIGK